VKTLDKLIVARGIHIKKPIIPHRCVLIAVAQRLDRLLSHHYHFIDQ
jgi:rhodanese-related sulfurtransferase